MSRQIWECVNPMCGMGFGVKVEPGLWTVGSHCPQCGREGRRIDAEGSRERRRQERAAYDRMRQAHLAEVEKRERFELQRLITKYGVPVDGGG